MRKQCLERRIVLERLQGPELFEPLDLAFPIAFDQKADIRECAFAIAGKRTRAGGMEPAPVEVLAGLLEVNRERQTVFGSEVPDILCRHPA